MAESLCAYEMQPDRYKQVAAELRVLVCETKENKPLLLDLLDGFGLQYLVQSDPELPLPLQMVGDIGKTPTEDFSTLSPHEIWARYRANAKPIPLREFVNCGLAVFIRPHEFSHRDLILAVAQQIGSAHEDRSVEVPLLELEHFLIGGYSGYGASLRSVGFLVLQAGRYLICHLAENNEYRPHYFTCDKT
ncbi:MAG: hypothetical protein HY000_34850 [Planctomycetes bacterium]|nr:hypothetical protein [Planctomycetota bacterium]